MRLGKLTSFDVILITSIVMLSAHFARVRSENFINNSNQGNYNGTGTGTGNDSGAEAGAEADGHHNGLPDGMGSSSNNGNDFFMDINADDDKRIRSSGSERILSRKRRYLVFPEGSSLQVVYDAIIPVVDYTNYLILGITVALAWELPSKPPSEILENFKEKLNDGTFGLSRNDTATNIKYIDTKPKKPLTTNYNTNANRRPVYYTSSQSNKFYPPMDYNYYSKQSTNGYYANKHHNQPPSSMYANWNRIQDNRNSYYHTKKVNPLMDWKKSAGWKIADRVSDALKKPIIKPSSFHPRHRIYPVFGKRSISDSNNPNTHKERRDIHMDKIDQIHLRHHRSSRHELYGKIEKYLHARGKNGQECVLKALCETGQKHEETEPGTFVGEIMRAIFTLPESHDSVVNHKHKLYDNAHTHDGDCSQRYPLCTDSIWSADFIF